MTPIKVWFPGFWTQAHRTHEKRLALENELKKVGIDAVSEYTSECQAAFVGDRAIINPDVEVRLSSLTVPKIHYVWDLYDANIHSPDNRYWMWYINILKNATLVLVPSDCTGKRFVEHDGDEKNVRVVKAPVHVWEPPAEECPGNLEGAVIDVMRAYPDPNTNVVSRACAELGIPCITTKTTYDWNTFRHVVANARLLVSAYWEASTGGLTLLEGYWHGVPVLLSNSPYNGVVDYFGKLGEYFQWDEFRELKDKIQRMCDTPPKLPSQQVRRKWIVDEYSEATFVSNVAKAIRGVL